MTLRRRVADARPVGEALDAHPAFVVSIDMVGQQISNRVFVASSSVASRMALTQKIVPVVRRLGPLFLARIFVEPRGLLGPTALRGGRWFAPTHRASASTGAASLRPALAGWNLRCDGGPFGGPIR